MRHFGFCGISVRSDLAFDSLQKIRVFPFRHCVVTLVHVCPFGEQVPLGNKVQLGKQGKGCSLHIFVVTLQGAS